MDCPNIDDIKFSKTSIDAIEDIRQRKEAGDRLIKAIGYGTIASIFVGNGMLETTYSLRSTDFEAMATAMGDVPAITRAMIGKTADMTYLRVSNYKEKQFWAAVSRGCSVH